MKLLKCYPSDSKAEKENDTAEDEEEDDGSDEDENEADRGVSFCIFCLEWRMELLKK